MSIAGGEHRGDAIGAQAANFIGAAWVGHHGSLKSKDKRA
jgi:hypothetical protein